MRNFRLYLLATVFVLIGNVLSIHAEMYKWVDEDGVVHFTDDPTNIPEKHKKDVKKSKDNNDRWQFIGTHQDGSPCYIDVESVKPTTGSGRSVFVKKVIDKSSEMFKVYKMFLKGVGADPERYSYSILENEVDCSKNAMKLLYFTDYDYSDNTLYRSQGINAKWFSVIPGSMHETILINACK